MCQALVLAYYYYLAYRGRYRKTVMGEKDKVNGKYVKVGRMRME